MAHENPEEPVIAPLKNSFIIIVGGAAAFIVAVIVYIFIL